VTARRFFRGFAPLLACAFTVTLVSPADAYLKFGTRVGDRVVSLKWNRRPVRYVVGDRGAAGVSADQLQTAIDRAFRTWQALETSDISFEFGGFTSTTALAGDGSSTLGFVNRPDLDRVLGQTSFFIDTRSGEILEADIFFNSVFQWSVAPAGEPDRFDLESVALHEIGHLQGLGHSAIGETELRPEGGRRVTAAGTVMFPIAFSPGNISARELQPDDIAGVSDLYAIDALRGRTGSMSGRVTKNGGAVFGAHVIAFNLQTAALVAGFSVESDGGFTIASLDPGVYLVRVEPIDDASVESFFSDAARVDVDFRVSYYERLVIVPGGGGTDRLGVKVTGK
jgi:hypothetical protein